MKKNYQKPTTSVFGIATETMLAASVLTLMDNDNRISSDAQLGKEQNSSDWDNIWK